MDGEEVVEEDVVIVGVPDVFHREVGQVANRDHHFTENTHLVLDWT